MSHFSSGVKAPVRRPPNPFPNFRFKPAAYKPGPFVIGAAIDHFFVLFNDNSSAEDEVRELAENLTDFGKKKGLAIPKPTVIPMNIKDAEEFFEVLNGDEKNFVLYVDTKEDGSSHDLLKLYERKYSVPTQHINAGFKLHEHKMISLLTVKINLKCGGRNRDFEYCSIPDDTLVMAIQMIVPQKCNNREIDLSTPNVVAFSFNGLKEKSDFIGDYAFEANGVPSIQNLHIYVKNMLKVFQKNRGRLPENIVFIRSCICDSQQKKVLLDIEVPLIRDACQQFSPDYSPKLNVIHFENKKKFKVQQLIESHKRDRFLYVKGPMAPPRIAQIALLKEQQIGQSVFCACSVILNEVDSFFKTATSIAPWEPLAVIVSEMCDIAQNSLEARSCPEPVHQAAELGDRGKRMIEAFKRENRMSDYWSGTEQQYDWLTITGKLALSGTVFAEKQIVC
ncbi:hypothetical protein QR680_008659 [Steinernema hermaphroditum]|uniref:Piwi domain-containing protein n=1 Tax=Steinernema hermaphroditum TaxID=289476 RepID=A0AA39IHE3_9BILA|nr:hypothetical protein QR680_008659 [Steinernema hermaphroditum]